MKAGKYSKQEAVRLRGSVEQQAEISDRMKILNWKNNCQTKSAIYNPGLDIKIIKDPLHLAKEAIQSWLAE